MSVYVSVRLGHVPTHFSTPVLAVLGLWSEKMQRTDPAENFKVVLTGIGLLNVVSTNRCADIREQVGVRDESESRTLVLQIFTGLS